MAALRKLCESGQSFCIDGSFCVELQKRGFDPESPKCEPLWTALANVNKPGVVAAVYRRYLEAGADVITTNTYQAALQLYNKSLHVDGALIVEKTAKDAVAARDRMNEEALVLGSVGPYAVLLGGGAEYHPTYTSNSLHLQKMAVYFEEQAECLMGAGVNGLLFETIPTAAESAAIGTLLSKMQKDAVVSYSCGDGVTLRDGSPLFDVARDLLSACPFVVGIGVNCTEPDHISSLTATLKRAVDVVGRPVAIVVYPNSGEKFIARGKWARNPCAFYKFREWHHLGARGFGGCCRIGSETIEKVKQMVDVANALNNDLSTVNGNFGHMHIEQEKANRHKCVLL